MAEERDSDMIMYFKTLSNQIVDGECPMVVDTEDEYVEGFQSADLESYSNFFQISKFEFGIEVKDEDKDTKTGQQPGAGQPHSAHTGGRSQTHAPQASTQSGRGGQAPVAGSQKPKMSFSSWRSGKMGEKSALIYPAMPDTFQFTRLIDRASVEFFDAVCDIRSYKEAVLVKRMFRGYDKPKQGFLKIKFNTVLITNLDWDDGDMLTETCKFICQSFDIQFRSQTNDGDWMASVPASWNYDLDAQPAEK